MFKLFFPFPILHFPTHSHQKIRKNSSVKNDLVVFRKRDFHQKSEKFDLALIFSLVMVQLIPSFNWQMEFRSNYVS
jgi:hypothetical protein